MKKVRKQATHKPSFSAPVDRVDDSADGDDKRGKSKKGQNKSESGTKKSKRDQKNKDKSKKKAKETGKDTNADKTHDKEKAPKPTLMPQGESPGAVEKRKQTNAARRAREARKKEKQRDAVEAETLNKLKNEEPIDQVKILLGTC